MSFTPLAYTIAVALVAIFALGALAEVLNLRALAPDVPDEFDGVYNADTYAKSQRYTQVQTRFGWLADGSELLILLLFWGLGGFGLADAFVRGFDLGPILTGLVFIGGLAFASEVIALPFSVYSTFVIEERFGFNRTDLKTFALDRLKGALLGVTLGGVLLCGILAFFEWAGGLAWLYAWVGVTLVSFALSFVAPTWILPLFNRFSPLEEGALRRAIFDYADSVEYPLTNIFVMDGSKRSTKSNAFLIGFGKNRRIALYDTLVENHGVEELVGVMAHEIGHFKKAHVRKGMVLSVLQLGVLFFLLSLVIGSPPIFEAFGVGEPSVYAGLVFFAVLYSPVSALLSVAMNLLSRRHEFEADRFAVETTGESEPLIEALKKLSLTNLDNLTPHPFYVLWSYTHPPLLQRIASIRAAAQRV